MTPTKKIFRNPNLAKIDAALRRAAQKARQTARETGTPLIIYKDGRIIRQNVQKEIDPESR
jgi:hypothetical protein